MSKKIRTEAVDYLFSAILSLENKEECYTFFEDICTINELLSLSQRFEVAKMLREQKTYLEIAEKTGASTATISRVNRSLTTTIRRRTISSAEPISGKTHFRTQSANEARRCSKRDQRRCFILPLYFGRPARQ